MGIERGIALAERRERLGSDFQELLFQLPCLGLIERRLSRLN